MDLHKGYYSFYPNETWTPSVNLYETDKAYVVCVDLAGVEKKKIDIEVVDQRLTIKGNRAVPVCPDDAAGSAQRPKRPPDGNRPRRRSPARSSCPRTSNGTHHRQVHQRHAVDRVAEKKGQELPVASGELQVKALNRL